MDTLNCVDKFPVLEIVSASRIKKEGSYENLLVHLP